MRYDMEVRCEARRMEYQQIMMRSNFIGIILIFCFFYIKVKEESEFFVLILNNNESLAKTQISMHCVIPRNNELQREGNKISFEGIWRSQMEVRCEARRMEYQQIMMRSNFIGIILIFCFAPNLHSEYIKGKEER